MQLERPPPPSTVSNNSLWTFYYGVNRVIQLAIKIPLHPAQYLIIAVWSEGGDSGRRGEVEGVQVDRGQKGVKPQAVVPAQAIIGAQTLGCVQYLNSEQV